MIDVAADDVLRAIVKAVKDTDGVDADAIARMLPVDDWGWKGGKPGEITGGDIIREIPTGNPMFGEQRNLMDTFAAQLIASRSSGPRFRALLEQHQKVQRAAKQMGMKGRLTSPLREFAKRFDALEKANIPREYTGAIERYFGKSDAYGNLSGNTKKIEKTAKKVSSLMESMTNDQRETFVALLPDWSGSLDELAETARNL